MPGSYSWGDRLQPPTMPTAKPQKAPGKGWGRPTHRKAPASCSEPPLRLAGKLRVRAAPRLAAPSPGHPHPTAEEVRPRPAAPRPAGPRPARCSRGPVGKRGRRAAPAAGCRALSTQRSRPGLGCSHGKADGRRARPANLGGSFGTRSPAAQTVRGPGWAAVAGCGSRVALLAGGTASLVPSFLLSSEQRLGVGETPGVRLVGVGVLGSVPTWTQVREARVRFLVQGPAWVPGRCPPPPAQAEPDAFPHPPTYPGLSGQLPRRNSWRRRARHLPASPARRDREMLGWGACKGHPSRSVLAAETQRKGLPASSPRWGQLLSFASFCCSLPPPPPHPSQPGPLQWRRWGSSFLPPACDGRRSGDPAQPPQVVGSFDVCW